MRSKLLCTVAALAMLSGLFVVGATPALAEAPDNTQNFLPDDTPGTPTETAVIGTFLSDKDDGTDTDAHLTNVSTRETSEVRWFLCPEERFTGTGQTVTDNDQIVGCDSAGTDTTGVTPGEGPGDEENPMTDEAYESFFNIPNTLEGDEVDVVAAACINSAAADFVDDASPAGDETNCTSDVEDQVVLDDGQTGVQGAQTSSGEITQLCAVDESDEDPCELEDGDDAGDVPDPDPEVDANFDDFPHGSNIPNDLFTIRATSSVDVTELTAFLREPADANNDPNGPADDTEECEEIDSDSNSREWQCSFDISESTLTDAEMELGIFDANNQAGNGGNCADPAVLCKLDAHYVVSQDREPAEAVLSFARQGSSTDDRDIALTAGCDEPDEADTNTVDDNSHLVGCFFDQFGALRESAEEASFESEGVGEFSDCEGGTPHDHDDDGLVEHCHADGPGFDDGPGEEGEFDAEVSSADTGQQNITFCLDEENDGTEASPPTDHGCADETVTATATKTWGSGIAGEVTLVFDDGDGDCEGTSFAENDEGESDNLIACVFDEEGNPVDTNDADADGQLQWFIDEGADDQTDTRFTETPPEETEEGNEADVGLQAVDQGTDNIIVELQDEDGNFEDSDTIQKQVQPVSRIRSTVSIRHRTGPHRFVGSVNPNSCDNNRLVRVRRLRPGRDPLIGSDRTNSNGRYVVRHRRTNRRFRYYAQLVRNTSCSGDRSPNTPRVR